MKSAFAHFDQRLQIINTVIKPGYAMARAASDAVVRPAPPAVVLARGGDPPEPPAG